MTKKVLVEPEAEADLLEAYDWYESKRRGLGLDLLLCFEAALTTISERPGSFPLAAKRSRRALLNRFPYLILFVELPDVIAILGVFHTRRAPRRWRTRAR